MEASHRRGRLGNGGERDAEEHVIRTYPPKKRRGSRMERGFKGPGGEQIQELYAQQVMSVKTLEGFGTQQHVAGCRREKTSSVSVPRHHKPENDLFPSGSMRPTS